MTTNRRLILATLTMTGFLVTTTAWSQKSTSSSAETADGIVAQASATTTSGSVKVRVSDPSVIEAIEAGGGRIVGDYGAFSIAEIDSTALQALPDPAAVEVLADQNRILLNSGAIDTSQPETKAMRQTQAVVQGKGMHLVQFAGPIQPDWLDALRKTGVHIVTYIPSNSYLVYGDAPQLADVQNLAAQSPHIQWNGAYAAAHRIDPRVALASVATNAATGQATPGLYAIQMVSDPSVNQQTFATIDAMKAAPVKQSYGILDYVNVVVSLPTDAVSTIAQRPDVISIQPYVEPALNCERQDQIVAGNLSGSAPSGPGYLAWLASKGFTQAQFTASGFAVDISDSGVDNGTTSPNHFGLYVNGQTSGTSRIIYNRLEGTANSGSTLKGCDGHGTLNTHIIAGYSDLTGFPFADGSGYRYGLGVAPFVKIGSSVIFDPSSFTSPSYANLQSKAYNAGARISSNSWGADTSGAYNSDSQAYDVLVRDAQPSSSTYPTAGNQEMVIVFSAGNAGSSSGTIGSPGSAKNVITVGAAENVQAFGGSDGCAIADTGADSANDIISFSSRGPTADSRKKPDLVAPGTHVSGGVIQAASPSSTGTADTCFTGAGVCGGVSSTYFPSSGQQFYTASSGTSHSCPAVAGAAALIRQFFINHGLSAPSPAMTKAMLMNSARYMTGVSAGDTLWSNSQGMGELNLGDAFDRIAVTPTILRDQTSDDMFTATGQSRTFAGAVADTGKPFRVTLVWTDAPGSTSGAAYKNDLNLTVTIGGNTYKGNVFSGAYSTTGGTADARDNVESVFLPSGTTGPFSVTVTAANINSDGVPNVGGSVDQDFALVVYNGTSLPVITAAGSTLASESCASGAIDPGETVTVNLGLQNTGALNATNVNATLDATGGVTAPSGPQTYGALTVGGAAVYQPFTFTASGACGSTITATLQLQDGTTALTPVQFSFVLGNPGVALSQNFDSVTAPALPTGWTATLASGSVSPWVTTAAAADSLPNSAFASDPSALSDNRLTSPSIAITTSSAQLTFRHSYNVESTYDGGVLEIAISGGAFTDIVTAGGSFVSGGYVATISSSYSSPIAGRQAWTGNSSGFITTKVNLPASAAGTNIQLRWRMASDSSVSGTGWYVDTIVLTDGYTCCLCATPPAVPTDIQATPSTICTGGSSVLSATAGSGGDTVEWFTDSCGGTAVSGGASPTVNPTATTTYYARTRSTAGACSGTSCATVTVTVNPLIAPDFNGDCAVDATDLAHIVGCLSGSHVPQTDSACLNADFDGDTDVDLEDFSILQRCLSGTGVPPDPNCVN